MKNLVVFLFAVHCLIFNACIETSRDTTHITRTYFNNTTAHVIKFLPYKNGVVITDSIKIFAPNSITLFESRKFYMPSTALTFGFNYQIVTDSIIVTFDSIKKEKHQNSQTKPVERTILPNDKRSLYSVGAAIPSFEAKIIEQRKNYIEVEFTYTFTEQDYVDAEPIN